MASPFWKGLFFIKGRIESVEILGVQPVGEDAQALAEAINLSKARQAQCFPGFGGFFITEENGTDCSSQRAYSTESSVGKPFLSRASSVCQMSFPRWMENRIRASRGTLGYSSL